MLKDEVREQQRKLKGATLKEKSAYVWEYYKWPILAVVVLTIAVIVFIVQYRSANRKKVLYGMLLNMGSSFDETAMVEDLNELLGVDEQKEQVYFETMLTYEILSDGSASYNDRYTPIKIQTQEGRKALDFIICDDNNIAALCDGEYFLSLETLCDMTDTMDYETLLSEYGEWIYYDVNDTPVGIMLPESNPLTECGATQGKTYYVCAALNTKHPQNVLTLIAYLTQAE